VTSEGGLTKEKKSEQISSDGKAVRRLGNRRSIRPGGKYVFNKNCLCKMVKGRSKQQKSRLKKGARFFSKERRKGDLGTEPR